MSNLAALLLPLAAGAAIAGALLGANWAIDRAEARRRGRGPATAAARPSESGGDGGYVPAGWDAGGGACSSRPDSEPRGRRGR